MSQESVWDYPRPPKVEPATQRIRVQFAGELVADSLRAIRVLETSHPPVYYIPRADVRKDLLIPSATRTYCEFKGVASYWSLWVQNQLSPEAAWCYDSPAPRFEAIRGHFAFYAGRVQACYVDEERVQAQLGGFYGGWVTSDIIGPFKGRPGSETW